MSQPDIRYYTCPHCGRKPKLRVTEAMLEHATVEMQCEICLRYFPVDLNGPSEEPPTEMVYRE